MFCMLGNIKFYIKNSPSSLNEKNVANFAEHVVLSGKPKLQKMPLALQELEMGVHLHFKLGNVEKSYKELIDAFNKQEPLALMIGNNKFKGNFVITEINSEMQIADSYGNALERFINLVLKESIEEPKKKVGKSFLSSLVPPVLSQSLGQIKKSIGTAREIINQGLNVANKINQAKEQVQDTVNLLRNFKDNPLSTLDALPAQLESLSSITDVLEKINFSQDLTCLGGIKESCATVLSAGDETAKTLQTLKNNMQETIKQGESSLSKLSAVAQKANHKIDEMVSCVQDPVYKLRQQTMTRLDFI